MRVLFAIDGSTGSFDAIQQVAALLSPGRDQVAFYCRPPEVKLRSTNIEQNVIESARDGLANAIFEEAKKHLQVQVRERVHTIIGTQDPRRGINIAAEQWAADLVVMGTRGLNTLGRLVLGSVSRAVVHATKCPVWLARPASAGAWLAPRVLLACECADNGQQLAAVLSQLTWPDESSFTAMTVIPSMFPGQVPGWLAQRERSADVEAIARVWIREHEEDAQIMTLALQRFVADLPPPLKGMRSIVDEGQAGPVILATANTQQTNLIVIGTRPKARLETMILGSTSETVLNYAECSVLVVPYRETP
jgi:nucleotide-binding universal stress UspA family protein